MTLIDFSQNDDLRIGLFVLGAILFVAISVVIADSYVRKNRERRK